MQVTDAGEAHLVSQIFRSALPVGVTNIPAERWKSFAVLVLEGAYEATLWAAVVNAHRVSSKILFLTQVGVGLDVRLVSYPTPDRGLGRLAAEFGKRP